MLPFVSFEHQCRIGEPGPTWLFLVAGVEHLLEDFLAFSLSLLLTLARLMSSFIESILQGQTEVENRFIQAVGNVRIVDG